MKIFLVVIFFSFALAQDLILTDAEYSKSGFVTTVIYNGQTYQHVDGIGWINSQLEFKILGNQVYLVEDAQARAKISNIRYGSFRNRIVIDIENYSADKLQYLEDEGSITEDEVLEIALPKLSFEPSLLKDYKNINQELVDEDEQTVFKIFSANFSYKIFVLAKPTRVVIDFEDIFVTSDIDLGHGLRYKKFQFKTENQLSKVHLLEIAPDSGHFEVVGKNYQPKRIKALANGAFAAINAGYFDTQNFVSIGYFKKNNQTLSNPARNRAVVAFGEEVLIDRLSTQTAIYINDKYYFATLTGQESDIMLYNIANSQVNDSSRAVIIVENGLVTEHSFAPAVVPENGFIVAYKPIIPDLLEVKVGDQASYQIDFSPKEFLDYPYAIEAGPVLLKDYNNVYEPRLEHFQVGQKILDSVTQQAAIGLKEDGTVLFLVAEKMTAAELIPLFESLEVKDAMRLDSGSSATLYANGKVLNRIFNRKLVTAIVFIPTE